MSRDLGAHDFDAFISYARGADGNLAAALRNGLHRFGRKLFSLRVMRVFLDASSLDVAGPLPTRLLRALDASRYLILVASPSAAQREWVDRELRHWIGLGRANRLIIVLADGELAWDASARRFDATRSTAAPATLADAFEEEPLWLDMRSMRANRSLALSDPDFAAAIAKLSACIQGRSVDELIGEDVAEQKRLVRLRRGAIVLLAALAVAAGLAAVYARRQQHAAEAEALRSEIRALAAQARASLSTLPDAALERSNEAFVRNGTAPFPLLEETYQAGHLVFATARATEVLDHPRNVDMGHFASIRALAAHPDRPLLAVGSDAGLFLLDEHLNAIRPMIRGANGDSLYVLSLSWSPHGRGLAVAGRSRADLAPPMRGEPESTTGWVRHFDEAGNEQPPLDRWTDPAPLGALAWDGERLAGGDRQGRVWTWSVDTRSLLSVSEPSGRAVNALVRESRGWLAAEGSSRELRTAQIASSDLEAVGLTLHRDGASDIVRTAAAHSLGVDCVTSSAVFGDVVATCGRDGWLGIWWRDPSDALGLRLDRRVRSFSAGLSAAAISPSGELIAAGSSNGEVGLWFRDGSPVTPPMKGHDGAVTALAWFGPGRLVSGGVDGTLRTWDTSDLVAEERALGSVDVRAGAARDRFVALVVDQGLVRTVDGRGSSWPERALPDGHASYAFALDEAGQTALVSLVAPDSYPYLGPLATAFSGTPPRSSIELWRSTGERTALADLGAPVGGAAFSRDGSRLAVGYGSELVLEGQRDGLSAALHGPAAGASGPDHAADAVRETQAAMLDALVGGFAVFSGDGALIAKQPHDEGIGVQVVASNPWAEAGSTARPSSTTPWFASTWGGDSIQLWSRDGEPMGGPRRLFGGTPLRVISAIGFIDRGNKVVVALASRLSGLSAPGLPDDSTAIAGQATPDLAIVDLRDQSVQEIVTDHTLPIVSIAANVDGTLFTAADGGPAGERGRRVTLWTSNGSLIASPGARDLHPILASRIARTGYLETLDAEGSLKRWPVAPEAIRSRLAARSRSLLTPRRVRRLIDESDAAEDNEQKLALLQEAIALEPNSARAFDRRAKLYQGMGRVDDAAADYGRAVALNPYEWTYFHNRAQWRLERGDDAGAEADLSAAIAVFDGSWVPILEPGEAEEERVFSPAEQYRTMRSLAKAILYELRAKARCRGQHLGPAREDAVAALRLGRSSEFLERMGHAGSREAVGSCDG